MDGVFMSAIILERTGDKMSVLNLRKDTGTCLEFAAIELRPARTDRGSLRISGLNLGLPLMQLVIKNLTKKYPEMGWGTQNNLFN